MNPYDAEKLADTIRWVPEMPPEERGARMGRQLSPHSRAIAGRY